jgi:hypothetical protein
MRQPEYRQGVGHTAIWRPMICEAGRPTAGYPSSCPRLSLVFMYLWLLGDSHSCIMAQVAFAPRDPWPCRDLRRGRPTRMLEISIDAGERRAEGSEVTLQDIGR